jgi:hypothetical protein
VLVNAPVPVPSLVVLLAVVGLCDVPYATPLAVTEAPPSDVTTPPVLAPLAVIEVIVAVETKGGHPPKPHVGIPLQAYINCPCPPGGKDTQLLPFQYFISPIIEPLGNVPAGP